MRRLLTGLMLAATTILTACNGADVVNLAARDAGVVQGGLVYGPLARQRLDVYSPRTVTAETPVLIFIHGGSWQNGSKEQYRFVGAAFANAGIETVVINYRLYPDVIFPDFMADAALAVAHVKAQLADNRPVFIAGHSAGAHIATLLAGDPRYLAEAGTAICEAARGVIGIAGPYTITPVAPEFRAIFPPDRLAAAQSISFAASRQPPTLVLHGTADTTVLPVESTNYVQALTNAGNQAELKLYGGVDHTMIIGAISPLVRASAPTFTDILAFIQQQKAAGYPGCAARSR